MCVCVRGRKGRGGERSKRDVQSEETMVLDGDVIFHLCVFVQILESSQTLLRVLKRENATATGGGGGASSVATHRTVPHKTQ